MKLVLAWLTENPEVMSDLTGLLGALAGYFLKKNKGTAMEPLLKLLEERLKAKQDKLTKEQLQELLKDI